MNERYRLIGYYNFATILQIYEKDTVPDHCRGKAAGF